LANATTFSKLSCSLHSNKSALFGLNPNDSELAQPTMKRGGNLLIATCRSGDRHPGFHVKRMCRAIVFGTRILGLKEKKDLDI